MKKIMSVVMAAAILISMTSCAPKKTPKEIYTDAMAKNAAQTSQDLSAIINMNMEVLGENATADMTMNIVMDTDIKMLKKGENYEVAMDAAASIMGQKMDIKYYYIDDYMYMDMMGQKIKTKTPIDEMQAQMRGSQAQLVEAEFMDKFDMTEDKEGNRTFTYTVLADKMDKYMQDALGAMGQNALPDDAKMSMGEMSGVVVVNKQGDVTSQTTIMAFTMEVEGMTMKITMDMDMVVNNIGQPVTITPPADLNEYMEMDDAAGNAPVMPAPEVPVVS